MSSKRFAGEVIWGGCALGFNETCFGFCVFASKPWPIRTGVQEEGSAEVPTESTCARAGKMQVDTYVKVEGFGEILKESTYARA